MAKATRDQKEPKRKIVKVQPAGAQVHESTPVQPKESTGNDSVTIGYGNKHE